LKLSEDKIYAEAVGTGGWGVTPPPPPPMQTRAAAGKEKAVRVTEVFLHNLDSEEMEIIGKAAEYGEAIALAHRSRKVPKGWNVAVTEANDERIVVACKKVAIISGVGAVTPPKPKAKKTAVLPEKLAGRPKNPEAAFAPKGPMPVVPGILNAEIIPQMFKRCNPRPLDPAVGFWDIKVEILREQTRHIRVRKDVSRLNFWRKLSRGSICQKTIG
jgi:hypothetical protein